MASQKIQLAIQRHFHKARTLGQTVAETWGEEDIHQFRVEVKKLRAYLRLAGATHTGLTARLPGKLHVFYSMTGIVRCLQLQRKGLEDAVARLKKELPDICSAALESRIDTGIAVIKEYLRLNSPFGKARAEWHAPIHTQEAGKAVETFIRDRKDRIVTGAVLPDEEELHTIRKAMKDILYLWSCFSDGDVLSILPERWRSRDNLRSYTDQLGEFHDICIQLQLLQDAHFLLSANDKAGVLLEDVRQLWRRDKEEKLEQLRSLLMPAAEVGNENPFAPRNLNAESYELHVD
ncbi:MAG TPA: CHAD domain-containing protein [Puia sp.]|nr:CHAD domain-containing protein [Puia sp.]